MERVIPSFFETQDRCSFRQPHLEPESWVPKTIPFKLLGIKKFQMSTKTVH